MKRILFLVGIALVFAIQFAAGSTPKTASAQARSGVTQICGISKQADPLGGPNAASFMKITPACLTIEIVDRATFKVRLPQNTDDRLLPTGTNTTTVGIFGGLYLRGSFGDTSYGDRDTQSEIKFVNGSTGNGDNGNMFSNNLFSRWDSLSADEIRNNFSRGGMTVLANNGTDGPLEADFCDSGDGSDEFFGLDRNDSSGGWDCFDNGTSFRDGHNVLFLDTNLVGELSNFNITHEANDDATTLGSLFGEDNTESDSFVFCEDSNKYALEKCEEPRDGYTISLTKDAFLGTGTAFVEAISGDGKPTISFRVRQAANTTNDELGTGGNNNTTTEDNSDSCESKGGVLGWVLCPVVNALDGFFNWVDTQIQSLLSIDEDKYRNEDLEQTWRTIRNIAYLILVPVILVMVIGTALGFEFVSAYTVKRALPRLITAVIFIALSWEITGFLVEFSNNVGAGVLGLITSSLPLAAGSDGLTLQDMFNATGAGAATQGVFILGIALAALNPAVLAVVGSFLATAAMIILAAFVVLIARQLFILALIIFAPLAIIAWIFPGNDKPWQFWWSTFSKLLIMFPLITALIGIGRVFAFIIGSDSDIITPILKLVAYVIPYAMIPLTFKFAGGLLGNVAGVVNDKNRGVFDRLKKGRAERYGQMGREAKSGEFFRGPGSRLNRPLSGVAAGPKAWTKRGGMAAARETSKILSGAATAESSQIFQANKNNDQFLLAAASRERAIAKMQAAEAKGDKTSAASWKTAIAAADQVPRTASTKLAAAQALAATGYQIGGGQTGYNELAEIMSDATGATLVKDPRTGNYTHATGSNAGAYANAMNSAQYGLKNAGRFDLAGINNGQGYDEEGGMGKVDPYTMASRAKPETIKQKGRMMRESLTNAVAAKAAGDMTAYEAEMEKAEVHRIELEAIQDNATGKNKQTASAEIATIQEETNLGAWREKVVKSEPGRVNYVDDVATPGWAPEEQARGWRMEADKKITKQGDVARSKAQGGRRPNPKEFED